MLLFIPRGVIRCRKNSCPDYSSYIGQAEANIVGKKIKDFKNEYMYSICIFG